MGKMQQMPRSLGNSNKLARQRELMRKLRKKGKTAYERYLWEKDHEFPIKTPTMFDLIRAKAHYYYGF